MNLDDGSEDRAIVRDSLDDVVAAPVTLADDGLGHEIEPTPAVTRRRRLHIVELFAGLEGWSSAAQKGDLVVTTDIERRFGNTITANVLDPDLGAHLKELCRGRVDVLLASPPCEAFSVMQIGTNWTSPDDDPPNAPKTAHAELAVRLVARTRELIEELEPAFWVIENPRAKLRRLPIVADFERRTVTYCKLGESTQKPTDLWGGFPKSLELPPTCKAGDPCHVAAPRGSRTGIQGDGVVTALGKKPKGARMSAIEREIWDRLEMARSQERLFGDTPPGVNVDSFTLAALRAKVPYELSRRVLEAARSDLS